MTDLDAALAEAAAALESASIPYMLIGGLAVAAWGEARATLDVDLAVWADPENLLKAIAYLSGCLTPRTADPVGFVERTRVLPLQSASGVRLDVVFGALPLQRKAISRAVPKQIAGRSVPVASVEDLILMKLVSERQKDLDDARALLRRHRAGLHHAYLAPQLEELAVALARPDILSIYRGES